MIAQRIKALMDERGMNRADLARKTEIPYHRLNPWFVRGNAKPNGPDIERVAAVLGVSVSYLIYGDEPNPASAREWIASIYDQLGPEEKKQLESFVRYLVSQRGSQGDGQG